MNKLQQAAQEYINRKNRSSNPDGEFDKSGRFYLSDSERCECCKGIRTPSRRFPYSEMLHGRTMKYVANLFDVSLKDLRKEVKNLS